MRTSSLHTSSALRLAAAAGGLLLTFGCTAQSDQPTAPTAQVSNAGATGSGTQTFSGQRMLGQTTVEPAVNDADGSTVFLLTPNHVPGVPFPAVSNPVASAPLYLPVYPTTSTIDPSTLDCQPTNCDHVNVLPFPAPGYVNGGQTCTQYGSPANGCALLLGHDHLIGVPPTGDYNVAWYVVLVVFTPKGVSDGAVNQRVMTLEGIRALEANGDAFEARTPIVFNCSLTSETTYLKGTAFSL